jgi:hypothetical protein
MNQSLSSTAKQNKMTGAALGGFVVQFTLASRQKL